MKAIKNGLEFEISDSPRFQWFWNIFNDGTWEPHTFKIFDKYLKDDKPYFDIGAWIGPTVLYGARKAAQCFAFEPDPIAFMELKANIVENNAENICAYNVAIGKDWENIELGKKQSFGDSMSSVLWREWAINVPTIPLETIGKEINPNFIKMDIEGGEMFVLSGAVNYLKEFKPTLYLSLHTPWFVDEDSYKYKAVIRESLKHYPSITCVETGEKISFEDDKWEFPDAFVSLVATYELD